MPLPIILGIVAAAAGAAGVGSGISGAVKMKDANDTMKSAQRRHEESQRKLKEAEARTNEVMDALGKFELEICKKEFENFSSVMKKIQNCPEFGECKGEIKVPEYDLKTLKDVSVGAGVLLGGLSGAAAGTAGGFAAAGATTAAVMALGSASTGTAIASLSGAAATNATLAALGGGALAAGGGGIALGTTVLGAATLGVGLLVGGVIFNITGGSLSDKADDAWRESKKEQETVSKICEYLDKLYNISDMYGNILFEVWKKYKEVFEIIEYNVNSLGKVDYKTFSAYEKVACKNSVLLMGCIFNMCKVKLVLKTDKKDEMNKINYDKIYSAISTSKEGLKKVA